MTITTQTRKNYKCPDWCERTDHDADLTAGEPAYHYSPDFGAFGVQAKGDGPFEAIPYLGTSELTSPEALRQVAADALAAADWWEANR